MGEYGLYGGHSDPSSLNAASAGEITLGSGGEWTLQAALYSNTAAHLHYRIEQATGAATQTLAKSGCMLTHGGTDVIKLAPVTGVTWYIYWFLCDAAGTAVTGGASDYLIKRVQRV